jgi:hypothetical protein
MSGPVPDARVSSLHQSEVVPLWFQPSDICPFSGWHTLKLFKRKHLIIADCFSQASVSTNPLFLLKLQFEVFLSCQIFQSLHYHHCFPLNQFQIDHTIQRQVLKAFLKKVKENWIAWSPVPKCELNKQFKVVHLSQLKRKIENSRAFVDGFQLPRSVTEGKSRLTKF